MSPLATTLGEYSAPRADRYWKRAPNFAARPEAAIVPGQNLTCGAATGAGLPLRDGRPDAHGAVHGASSTTSDPPGQPFPQTTSANRASVGRS